MTEYHDLITPTEGTTDWHVPLNNNFKRIDRRIEIRADESELDSFEPKKEAKFLAVDTATIYIGNGDEWRELPVGDAETGVSYEAGDATVQQELLDTYTAPSSKDRQRQEISYEFTGLDDYDEYQMVVRTYNQNGDNRDRQLEFCSERLPETDDLRSETVLRTVGHAASADATPQRARLQTTALSTVLDVSDGVSVREVPDPSASDDYELLRPSVTREISVNDSLYFEVDEYSAFAPDLEVSLAVYGTILAV